MLWTTHLGDHRSCGKMDSSQQLPRIDFVSRVTSCSDRPLIQYSFDGWTFYNGVDANTTGNVLYQTREQATQEQLAYVNSAGHAIIKVDNTTNGANDPTYGRASVKILSNTTVPQGSLVLMDAVHMPFGVRSVFFWMYYIERR